MDERVRWAKQLVTPLCGWCMAHLPMEGWQLTTAVVEVQCPVCHQFNRAVFAVSQQPAAVGDEA